MHFVPSRKKEGSRTLLSQWVPWLLGFHALALLFEKRGMREEALAATGTATLCAALFVVDTARAVLLL